MSEDRMLKSFNTFCNKIRLLQQDLDRINIVLEELRIDAACLHYETIDKLNLSKRSSNCLKQEGIETVKTLIGVSQSRLLCIPNMGKTSINEIKEKLASLGLSLGMYKGD